MTAIALRCRVQALPLIRLKSACARGVHVHHRLYASSPSPSSSGGRLKSWPERVGTRTGLVTGTDDSRAPRSAAVRLWSALRSGALPCCRAAVLPFCHQRLVLTAQDAGVAAESAKFTPFGPLLTSEQTDGNSEPVIGVRDAPTAARTGRWELQANLRPCASARRRSRTPRPMPRPHATLEARRYPTAT